MKPVPKMLVFEKGHLRISHSSFGHTFGEACENKFALTKLFSHVKRGDESHAGEVGKALHTGLESYFISGGDKNQAIADFMIAYPHHITQYNNYRSLEASYASLLSILETDLLQDDEIVNIVDHEGVTRPAVEIPFEIFLDGFLLNDDPPITVSYIGWIDLIMYQRLSGARRVLDLKSHRDTVKDLTPKYFNSVQCLPYGLVLEYMLGHTIEFFNITYVTCFIDLMEPKIKIYTFPKGKNEISNWFTMFVSDLWRLKEYFQIQWFPRRGGACMSWKRPCPMFEICTMSDWESIQGYLTGDEQPVDNYDATFKPWVSFNLEIPKLGGG